MSGSLHKLEWTPCTNPRLRRHIICLPLPFHLLHFFSFVCFLFSFTGIRRLCSELLDLKDAVDNLCGNMQSKYTAFVRLSEEVIEMEHELIDLQKHISTQGILVQDLMRGVCRELEEWKSGAFEAKQDLPSYEIEDFPPNQMQDPKTEFFDTIDVLLAEHRSEEALAALKSEEEKSQELLESKDNSVSSYKLAFLKRKEMLSEQLVEIAEQPSSGVLELKKSLLGLVKLGNGPSAHQLLLNAYGSRLQKSINGFLPLCSIYPGTYSASLSQLVFSTISVASRESNSIFGDAPPYGTKLKQWIEWELESMVQLVRENAPSSETPIALRAATVCVQASLSHCLMLEFLGLSFSQLLLILLCPYMEEVLDMNFKRAMNVVVDFAVNDDMVLSSPQFSSPFTPSNIMVTNSGKKFISVIQEIVEQLTPNAILHYGGNILYRLAKLFDSYIDALIKVLPGSSEDDNPSENKDNINFRAETDAQQLALLGTAFTVAEELLPMAVSGICSQKNEGDEPVSMSSDNSNLLPGNTIELKDLRRHLKPSLDKLRDHYCRHYVLSFIYSSDGKPRLDARLYLNGKAEDLFWDSDPLPSLPFQALFTKLQELASVAADVLIGKEKIQKILLARLTETVVIWLSNEQDFWEVFEDESVHLQPFGLQQLIFDMHFIVEIAVCGGYPSRQVRQIALEIISRAIGTFATRGIDPHSALPEDEWFVDMAKAAINRFLLGTPESSEVDEHNEIPIEESDLSEIDEDHVAETDRKLELSDGHINLEFEGSDFDEEVNSSCSIESGESFASARMDDSASPSSLTDPET
ncbi:hypothetical protein AMTRI_Chr02g212960 [Amborella trichopoda]